MSGLAVTYKNAICEELVARDGCLICHCPGDVLAVELREVTLLNTRNRLAMIWAKLAMLRAHLRDKYPGRVPVWKGTVLLWHTRTEGMTTVSLLNGLLHSQSSKSSSGVSLFGRVPGSRHGGGLGQRDAALLRPCLKKAFRRQVNL